MTKVIKDMKKTTKKVTKTQKPEVWVDMTNIKSVSDAIERIIIAKVRAGLAINENEINTIVEDFAKDMLNSMFTWNNAVLKNNGKYVKLNLSVAKPENQPVKDTDEEVDTKVEVKKSGFFKRIWNWITGKK